MGIFSGLFDLLAIPMGWLLGFIYKGIPNYFLAIFLFTFVVRLLLFPLSLKTQKNQADRARLAPRLERLQKKYAKDPKKLQEKQMALYEKAGVSMTGGCMPMLVQMLVLFGIISVIYSPIKHLTSIPDEVVTVSVEAMTGEGEIPAAQFNGYYKELRVLQNLETYETDVKEAIAKLDGYDTAEAEAYYDEMVEFEKNFNILGSNMLENPWNEKGFAGISVLWLIPLLSGLTAMGSGLLSMHYTKQSTAAEAQQMQGCTNVSMMIMMPAMSLFISFSVPGGVGIYWICSNLIAMLQTFVLNRIYNPAKIRAQAEIEYEQRRKQKQEDKKRLAEARAREQRELARQQQEEKKPSSKKKAPVKKEQTPQPQAEETVSDTQPAADGDGSDTQE